MAIVRPEVIQSFSRFRDALVGVLVSMLGLYWAIDGVGFISILGTSLTLAGALLIFAGIQRGRFKTGTGGAGVVHVDEGQVTYFGPLEGGSVVISDLSRVELFPLSRKLSEWVLYDPGTDPLHIPTNAEGAEALFDVFSNLEGLQMEKLLDALKKHRRKQVVIWQSKHAALH